MLRDDDLALAFCANDSRHPVCEALAMSDRMCGIEPAMPMRSSCACDSCFYGRSRLAVEIVRLRELLDTHHVDWRDYGEA